MMPEINIAWLQRRHIELLSLCEDEVGICLDPCHRHHHQIHMVQQKGWLWWSFPGEFLRSSSPNKLKSPSILLWLHLSGEIEVWQKQHEASVFTIKYIPLIRFMGNVEALASYAGIMVTSVSLDSREICLWKSIQCWMRWGWEPRLTVIGLKPRAPAHQARAKASWPPSFCPLWLHRANVQSTFSKVGPRWLMMYILNSNALGSLPYLHLVRWRACFSEMEGIHKLMEPILMKLPVGLGYAFMASVIWTTESSMGCLTRYNLQPHDWRGRRKESIFYLSKKEKKEKRQNTCYKCWYSLLDLASSNGKTMHL